MDSATLSRYQFISSLSSNFLTMLFALSISLPEAYFSAQFQAGFISSTFWSFSCWSQCWLSNVIDPGDPSGFTMLKLLPAFDSMASLCFSELFLTVAFIYCIHLVSWFSSYPSGDFCICYPLSPVFVNAPKGLGSKSPSPQTWITP